MSIGFWQIAIVVVLVVLLFGRGKISALMGDVAKVLKVLKKACQTIQIIIMIQRKKIIQIKTELNATNWLV